VNREVGIAALDQDTNKVALIQASKGAFVPLVSLTRGTQLADCQTYVKTLHHLDLHYPSVIIVPDSSLLSGVSKQPASLLLQYIREEFSTVPIEPILRKYWNETVGE
jgi:DNA mismatch repair protein MSH4